MPHCQVIVLLMDYQAIFWLLSTSTLQLLVYIANSLQNFASILCSKKSHRAAALKAAKTWAERRAIHTAQANQRFLPPPPLSL